MRQACTNLRRERRWHRGSILMVAGGSFASRLVTGSAGHKQRMIVPQGVVYES